MATWPSTLPLPQLTFEGTVSPSVIRTEMEAGNFRQRKRFTQTVDTFQVAIPLTPSQYSIFDTFFKTDLFYGANWFNVSLNINGTLQTKSARFVNGLYSFSKMDNKTEIKATWEVQ